MIASENDESGIRAEELLSTCVFFLWAGHETTKNFISSGIYTLLANGTKPKPTKDMPLNAKTVEEFLRFESPLQKIVRWAKEDVQIGGKLIRKDDFVVCLLGAANRDPDEFTEPDNYNPDRTPNRHLSLGSGIHTCLGAGLARLEGRLSINEVFCRFPTMRLAAQQPVWRPYSSFRSLESLPIKLQK